MRRPILKKSLFAGVLIGGLVAGAIWGYFTRVPQGAAAPAESHVALPTPKLPTMPLTGDAPLADYAWSIWDLDGREIPFDTFRGKVIFLSFWATWCVPCLAEMPSIERLKEELAGEDVAFALVADQSPRVLKRFAAKHPFDLTFYRTPTIPSAFKCDGFPTTMVIDPAGRIILRETDGARWDAPEAIAFIKGLLRK